jgi:tetratricopeptide (TPR) repeat protein
MDEAEEPMFGTVADDGAGASGGTDEPGMAAGLGWEESVTFEDDAGDEEPLPLLRFDLEAPLDLPEPPIEEPSAGSSIIMEDIAAFDRGATRPAEGPPAAPAVDPLADLRERVVWNPKDADAWRELGDLFFSTGSAAEGTDAFERAHALYAEQGDPERAMRVVRELLIREPRRIELRQRLVEYAHQTKERTLLVQAFLELADGFRAEGDDVRARAVLEQVLAIDPTNIRANEALGPTVPGAVATTPAPAPEAGAAADGAPAAAPAGAGSGAYVDLGAMVLEPEGEGTTRWVVKPEEPSGDEEADFARMLSQFKQKVAQNISMDDARAHYDLGMAYKEMGLLREAIGEFQQALRADPDSLGTFEMLGQCFLDLGDPDVAIRTLERGLKLETEVEDELLGVYYGLAMAHERVGNADTARDFYERIFSLDINFKDVVERLKALR